MRLHPVIIIVDSEFISAFVLNKHFILAMSLEAIIVVYGPQTRHIHSSISS